jgi:uncharacterized protein YjiS (DUF1127 family)
MSATLSTTIRPEATESVPTSPGIKGHFERIACYFVRRAAIAHLRELGNDGLKDIGLGRSEIEAAVCGLATAHRRGKAG